MSLPRLHRFYVSGAAVVLAAAGLALYASPTPDGRVTDASGRPLPGVHVTATRPDGVVAYSVVTDGNGEYAFESIPAGSYTLTASRIGYVGARKEGFNPTDGAATDLQLSIEPEVIHQAPSSAFLSALPDGLEKRAFILDCTGCHQLDQRIALPGSAPRSHSAWASATQYMLSFAGASSPFPIMSPSRNAQATATFLSTHLNRVPAYQAPSPMTGADAAFTTTEYRVPGWGDLPHDLMPDSQGRIIITGMMTQQMYVLDPASSTYSTVPTPANGARALDIGPDGTWYVALGQGNQVAAYDPRTQQWRSWSIGMYP
ncbi:MAG TPA: carboxypeptidase regulatory-like domain-containing protein, partial [Rhodothermales bacterium]|nr:carboxypeptidase regulatory-like domain-containing protein [Rhodothermales bacterium]